MSRPSLTPLFVAAAALIGCGGGIPSASPSSSPSQPRTAEPRGHAGDTYDSRFAAADADAVAELYAPEARWFLSNGEELHGREQIRETLQTAFSSDATSLRSTDLEVLALSHGRTLAISRFELTLSATLRIEGQRYAQWRVADAGPVLLETDCWVPDGPSANNADITSLFEALDRGYERGDADAVAGVYADAQLTLSNGRHIPPETSDAFLRESAMMGLQRMHHTTRDVRVLPSDTAYVRSGFSFEMPTPDGPRAVQGEQLAVLQQTDSGWRIVLELAWPREG